MAQTQQNNSHFAELWAESAARCGYAVANGVPLIGISSPEGEGFIVPMPAPAWFGHVPEPDARDNVFRALAQYALRFGQGKLGKEPSREKAVEGVAGALNGAQPEKERDKDVLETAAMRSFETFIRERLAEKAPNATEAVIEQTIKDEAALPRGKAFIERARQAALESGTYTVARKRRGKVAAVASLDDY